MQQIILMPCRHSMISCILLNIPLQHVRGMSLFRPTGNGLTALLTFLPAGKPCRFLYDPFFKMIFNLVESRARLSELVSCILGQHVTVIEVFPHTNYTFPNSFVIMDMVVRLDNGSITNIEIQKVPYDFPAERISCYSADLVLRQFRMLKGMETENTDHGSSSYGKPSYSGMKKVHTIIFFEKSSSSLKSPVNKKAYFHVGKTTFNTSINISLLQEYHLISLDTFKKYRYSDIMDGRIDIDSTGLRRFAV